MAIDKACTGILKIFTFSFENASAIVIGARRVIKNRRTEMGEGRFIYRLNM